MISFKDVLIAMHEKELPLMNSVVQGYTSGGKEMSLVYFWRGRGVPKIQIGNSCVNVCIGQVSNSQLAEKRRSLRKPGIWVREETFYWR